MAPEMRTSGPESADPSAAARKLAIITALWCGAMAIVGISLAAGTYIATPGVESVPAFINAETQRIESKWQYLFVIPSFQVFLVIMFAFPLARWRKYWKKSVDSERHRTEKFRPVGIELPDQLTAIKAVCIGGCVSSVMLVGLTAYRCSVLVFGAK